MTIKRWLRQLVSPVLAVSLMGYFAYHLVEGERGLKRYFLIREQIEQAESIDRELARRRLVLEHRIQLLRTESLDLDLLTERSMIVLGHIHAMDRIVVSDSE